jgi:2-desacetyl-2-hydroxyethyl bacteriochlorophyllide A dehydrogenase
MMRGLVKAKAGPGNIEVRDVEEPHLNENEVLIQIVAAGICHTDLLMVNWGPIVEKEYHPALPLVMGHEFSGKVLKVGNRVDGFEVGDPVVVNPILTCGHCSYCLEGKQQVCNNRTLLGFQKNGGFAERISVRAENVYKLPKNVDLEIAALCEPFNTIIRAFERANPIYGDTLLISGPGPMGMLALLMGQYCGCGKIIMTGLTIDQQRLQMAEKLGAIPINIEKENVKERVRDITQGTGVAVIIETSGSGKALSEDLDLLKRCGKLILVGLSENPTQFVPAAFALNETEMIGIRAYNPKTWETCLKILSSGKINLKPLITHHLPLDEGEKGFQLLQQREGLKILITP